MLRTSLSPGRPAGRSTSQHAFHADVLVDVGPVHSRAITDDLVVLPLLRRRLREAPRPGERHADGTTIYQVRDNEIRRHLDCPRARVATRLCRSAHARSPGCG